MSSYGQQFLSKVIDSGDLSAFTRFGITREYFVTAAEKSAVDYVFSYADTNGGRTPSYATFAAENPDVMYIPDVTDEFTFLAREIKDSYGKRQFAELVNKEVAGMYETMRSDELISALQERLEAIKIGTSVRESIGKTLAELKDEFRAEYDKRKSGKSFRLWKTPFRALNEQIGGLYSGDVYGIMAESGRGKTYLSEVIVDELLRQGAKVLVKSYEVKGYPWLSRLISIITAREGALTSEELAVKIGLPNKAVLSGKLDGDIEAYFFDILAALDTYYPGKLYLQAKSDAGLTRTLDDLDRELQAEDVDAVVIDAFYNLDDVYGRNANKTAGGAAEQAARRLERIIGERDVVGIYTIQARTEKSDESDEGERELRLPGRERIKTTGALLDITTNLFAFDSVNGNGKLGVEKGRNGGEGFTIDLIALMDYGVLRELPDAEEAAGQFVGNF
ncbi:DnaB-like helicase C-terminal domain-containing protein [Paenibacillus sp. GCM10012307]|uniref:DNA helicase n=1 Tax=Paenibacillus roseus TaxID=2798579 RepID=A0A934MRF6_9BACL|nr:DnaB-like helicase C-terminal domain-containing protein [Paenibacillus roseus]MBJ6364211.1 DNA helicase [Paenibacillus roseus]